jgi:NAD dependent epimerase/dehydratase
MSETVLVTGAGGFIGSHLVERCVGEGFRVKAFVHYNSRNDWGWLESNPVTQDVEIITGDVRDFDAVSSAMRGVDGVFHLAALIGIPYSYVSPLAYIRTNVEGTYNVVEAGRQAGVSNIVITSTSETYGTAQYTPIDEDHPSVGQSPYAATKIAADEIALSYWRSFNTPVKIARPFNTYGPRQSGRAVIPTIISQIAGGSTEISLGNLTPTRDFTFVKDTVAGFLAIHRSGGLFGEDTNIGMSDEISIGDLVRLVAELMHADVSMYTHQDRVRPEKSEVERLFCDNRKILAETDWRPTYTLRTGLEATIEWIRANQHTLKADRYNV